MKRKLLRKNKWIWIELISAVVIIVFLLLLAVWFQQSKKNLKVKSTACYYDMGKKVEIKDGSEIRKEDDRTVLETKSETVEVESIPLISQKGREITLTAPMAYVNASNQYGMTRVNYYAKIYEDKASYYVKDGKREDLIKRGFLFDGKDLYVFIEPMQLVYEDKVVDLGPLSYVKVLHNQSIEIYNSKTKRYNFEVSEETAVKAISEKGYELNLDNDILIHDGSEQILFSNVAQLPVYRGDTK